MKIAYYPGCTLNTVAKGFDTSARESAVLLGFELKELGQWNCCGATFPLTPDNVMGLTAPTKVLVNAKREGDTVTTLCSVCYNVLKRTNKVVRDDKDKRSVVNTFIEEEYDGSLNVIHFLEILRDKIGFDKVKAAVKRPLKGVKAGAYYGCMLLRPFEDMGIDNAEAPTIIVTSCPLCQYNLEKSQQRLTEGSGNTQMPILYFTQLLGLALGQDEGSLGLEKNLFDVRPLLKEKGI